MANIKIIALFSSIFLTFVQLDNAIPQPFHGLKEELNVGKYHVLHDHLTRYKNGGIFWSVET